MAPQDGAISAGPNPSAAAGNGGGGRGGAKVLKKGPWSEPEDAILVDYVTKHGTGNWNNIPRQTGLLRCGKSCRLRWMNHLRSNLKKGGFTPEEESKIQLLHARYGNKWSLIALHFKGHTDNEIKNFWNIRYKKLVRDGLPIYTEEILRQYPHLRYQYHRPQPKKQLQKQRRPSSSSSRSSRQANPNFDLVPFSSSSTHQAKPNSNSIPFSSTSTHQTNPNFSYIMPSSSHHENSNFDLVPLSSSSTHQANPNFSYIVPSSSYHENHNFDHSLFSSSSTHEANPNSKSIPFSSTHQDNPYFSYITPSSSYHENSNFNPFHSSSPSSPPKNPNINSIIPSSSHYENSNFNPIPLSSPFAHPANPSFNSILSSSLFDAINHLLLSALYHPDFESGSNLQFPSSPTYIPLFDQNVAPFNMTPTSTMDNSTFGDVFLFENIENEIPSIQSSFQTITPTSSSTTLNDHIIMPSNGVDNYNSVNDHIIVPSIGGSNDNMRNDHTIMPSHGGDNYNLVLELFPNGNSGLLEDVVAQSQALSRFQLSSKEDKESKDDKYEGMIITGDDTIMNETNNNMNLESIFGSSNNDMTFLEDSTSGFSSIDVGVRSQGHVFAELTMMDDYLSSWFDLQPNCDASTELTNASYGTVATVANNLLGDVVFE